MKNNLPLADPSREEDAERIFRDYRNMTPEEYAARFAHTIGCSSFDNDSYRNRRLNDWIHRRHEILQTSGEAEKYREKYLSEPEKVAIRKEIDNQEENGL